MKLWETLLVVLALISLLILGLVRTVGAGPVAAKDLIANGTVTRIAQPGTVFWGEPVDVEVRIDAAKLPPCQTPPPPPPPIYAALVIDRSGSMGAERKIEEARNSALEFVDLMDLSEEGGRVTVIAFDDTASVLRKFSYNRRAVRLAITSLKAMGGTNIADGLDRAGQQFDSASPPAGATSIVILLSDGISDPASAVQAAERLKARGIRVAAIGLGSDADEETLRRIASSDDDYYRAASAGSLLDIYDEIASGMVGTVATNVNLVEYFNNEHFRLTGETYRGNQSGNRITWQIPFVGRLGRSASYFLLPASLGGHTVSPTPGQLDLTDCNGQPFSQPTPTGPVVLVLPPAWLFYLFPALAFIWLLIRLYLWLTQEERPRVWEPGVRPQPSPPEPKDGGETPGDKYDWHTEKDLVDRTGHPLVMRIGGAKEDDIRKALGNNSSALVRLFIEEKDTQARLGSMDFSLVAEESIDSLTRKSSTRRATIIRKFDIETAEDEERGITDLLLQEMEDTSRQWGVEEICYPNPGEQKAAFIARHYQLRQNDKGETEVFKAPASL